MCVLVWLVKSARGPYSRFYSRYLVFLAACKIFRRIIRQYITRYRISVPTLLIRSSSFQLDQRMFLNGIMTNVSSYKKMEFTFCFADARQSLWGWI